MAVLWEEKFAGGVIATLTNTHLQGNQSALTVETSRVRLGSYGVQCTAGDTGSGSTRAEIGRDYDILLNPALGDRPGDTVWYGWSQYIPSTMTMGGAGTIAMLFQWYNNKVSDHGNGLAFGIVGNYPVGNDNFGVGWGLTSGVWNGATFEYDTGYLVGLDANPAFYSAGTGWGTNIWWDFKLKIGCATGADGSVDLWAKASTSSTWVQLLSRSGIPTMEVRGGDTNPSYGLKTGLYQTGYAATNSLWHGGVVRATSESDVELWFTGASVTTVTEAQVPTAPDWRTIICDLNGLPISNITRRATDRAFQFRLNRPDSYTFRVPSDAPEVVGPWSDNRPYIEEGTRTIKAYRRELADDGVTYRYVLRFAGTIETVQDEGTPDDAHTTVVAYSPFYTLNKRLCRDSAGNPANVTFDNASAVEIVANLLAWTITYAGNPGIAWGGAARGGAIGTFTASYQYQTIASAIIGLTDSFNGFDILWVPKDRTDGVLATATVTARAGVTQAHVVFGWGVAPHNVETITNFKDRGTLANVIYGIGPDGAAVGPASDGSSIALYGQLETSESLGDVNAAMVSPLITEELSFRKQPRQIVQIVPGAGVAFRPFIDFGLGDMINVWAGTRLRGGFTGVQRVYGFDLSLNDEAIERISAIYVSADT